MVCTAAAGFAGCTAHEPGVQTPINLPDSFSRQGGVLKTPNHWWQVFKDADLNAHIDAALNNNFELKSAWYRLQQAQSLAQREASALLPRINGDLEQHWRKPRDSSTEHTQIFGVSAAYEVDLFRKLSSQAKSEALAAQASAADHQAAALSLAAAVTITWYQMIEAERQRDIINAQIQTNQKVLNLMEERLGTGRVSRVDTLRQRSLLAASEEQRIEVNARAAVLAHQFSILLGQTPQQTVIAAGTERKLPALQPLPDLGVPLALIQRRPDVQSAFLSVQSADQAWASAIADRWPRLSLSASVTHEHRDRSEFIDDWLFNLAGNLVAPIMDGGRRKAEAARVKHLKFEKLQAYGQRILIAIREVEDALAEEHYESQRIKNLNKQLDLASQTYEQLRLEYFNGAANYLDVLNALSDLQHLKRETVTARLALITHRIKLYRALAGGLSRDETDAS